jgi:hypothetical protein
MQATLLYSQAMEAVKNGQKAQARQLLDELVVKEPRNENAWLLLSEVVEHKNELIDCLTQVITINPQNKIALEKLQQILPHPIPKSIAQVISKAVNASSGSKPVISNIQIAVPDEIDLNWLEQNQATAEGMKPDINNLRQLVKLDPKNEEAWLQLSKLVSDPVEAADCLRHALAINPYNTVAKLRLAQLIK